MDTLKLSYKTKSENSDEIYKLLIKAIKGHNKVYITLNDFYTYIEIQDKSLRNALNYPNYYNELEKAVSRLIDEEIIEVVKSSKCNSKNMKLTYRIIKQKACYDDTKREILKLAKPIQIEYYLAHPHEYLKEKEYIYIIDTFLRNSSKDNQKDEVMSINERSYQLFGDEKFLRDSDKARAIGERILKNLGLKYSDLNCFYSYEPFFCFTKDEFKDKLDKRVLILENKDTFWSFKRLLFDFNSILDFDMIIYGEGNKIVNSFQFVEQYKLKERDEYLYFGDLDAEGINIFFSLTTRYTSYNIAPFTEAYRQLINKSSILPLHKVKKAQKVSLENVERFSACFDEGYAIKINDIVTNNYYIPQEAITFVDLRRLFGGF